jgi:RimJ/RimL family protein N-acetyltransferase
MSFATAFRRADRNRGAQHAPAARHAGKGGRSDPQPASTLGSFCRQAERCCKGRAGDAIGRAQKILSIPPSEWPGRGTGTGLARNRRLVLQAGHARAATPEDAVEFDPASYHVTETLVDGREVAIRAQRPEDRESLHAAVRRASSETLRFRFLAAKRELTAKEQHVLLDVDFVTQVALVAEAREDDLPVIVGGCRYMVIEPGRAEVAFSIIDDYQGKGLGTALVRHIAAIGREAGLYELVAEVLSDNEPMLKVFRRSGLAMTARRDGAVVRVSLRYRDAKSA